MQVTSVKIFPNAPANTWPWPLIFRDGMLRAAECQGNRYSLGRDELGRLPCSSLASGSKKIHMFTIKTFGFWGLGQHSA